MPSAVVATAGLVAIAVLHPRDQLLVVIRKLFCGSVAIGDFGNVPVVIVLIF